MVYEKVNAPEPYELARDPAADELVKDRKTERHKVIPDAWLLFEKLNGGVHKHFIPIWLEVDRGSEHSRKFKQHIRSRIECIRSGAYKKMFETDAVTIAYVTTGDRPEYRETRRRAMCTWAQEVLKELGKEKWSHIFRFTSVEFDQLYSTPLFDEDEPVWYKPVSPIPVPLFSS